MTELGEPLCGMFVAMIAGDIQRRKLLAADLRAAVDRGDQHDVVVNRATLREYLDKTERL